MAAKTMQIRAEQARKGIGGYEAMWMHMMAFDEENGFTIPEIMIRAETAYDQTRDFFIRLRRAGYLEKTDKKRGLGLIYKILLRQHRAPSLKRNGAPRRAATGRDYMWRAIRMMGAFTAPELALAASTETTKVSLGYAENYIHHLLKAGYLKIVTPHKSGHGRTISSYRLLASKNTGPRPPVIQGTKAVFDQNLGQVVWQKGGLS